MSSASYPRQRAHCMAFPGAKLSSAAALCSAVPCHTRHVTTLTHVDSSYAALSRLAHCQNWITQLRAHAHAARNRSERHRSLLKTGSCSTSNARMAFPIFCKSPRPFCCCCRLIQLSILRRAAAAKSPRCQPSNLRRGFHKRLEIKPAATDVTLTTLVAVMWTAVSQ
jgi:hypothetical protein